MGGVPEAGWAMSQHKIVITESGTGATYTQNAMGGDTFTLNLDGGGKIEVFFDRCPDDIEADDKAKREWAAVRN